MLLLGLSAGYAAFSSNISLNAKGNIKNRSAEKLGYVTDGLQVAYDSIEGLTDNNKYLFDISGNGQNGELKNFSNVDLSDGLKIDGGLEAYVLMDEMNYENVTMQIVLKYDDIRYKSGYYYSFNNFESGGHGFFSSSSDKKNLFDVLVDSGYLIHTYKSSYKDANGNAMDDVSLNKVYFLSGSYDNYKAVLFENDHKYFIEKEVTIKFPGGNTHLIIGGNPSKQLLSNYGSNFNGRLYVIRVYNRALTDDEL